MATVYFPNGDVSVLFPGSDGKYTDSFAVLLEEKLGADVARMFRSIISDYEAEIEMIESGDKDQEVIADGYLQLCHEAEDNFRVVLDKLDAPRLNRTVLKAAAQRGYDALHKNL